MDLRDELKALSSKVEKQFDLIQTEEATKNAFIMPFISALGYNVFDPTEVTPELTADMGTKKGEKVDYAILQDGKPIILFECKWCGIDLDKEHKSQLYRYFSVTEARFGILTNGIIYRFYSDLEESNKMDSKAFLEFNLLDMKDSVIEELKRFSKSFFSLDDILAVATELKYTREIKRILTEQLTNPNEDFVRFFGSQIYSGKLTQAVKQQFASLTKKALHQFINDQINERLKSALAEPPTSENLSSPTTTIEDKTEEETLDSKEAKRLERESRIETTDEEVEGHHIIQAILRDTVDSSRVVMRDKISYCGILFDNNNRKPICRLYFNNSQNKRLALFDKQKTEEKVSINELNDIYQYADRLVEIVNYYLSK